MLCVTAERVQENIDLKSAFFKISGWSVLPKISGTRDVPHQPLFVFQEVDASAFHYV